MNLGRTTAWRSQNESGSEGGDPRVVAAVQEYLRALESGKPPARKDFLARYPQFAQELDRCLDGLELVHRAAPILRHGPGNLASELASEEPPRPLGDFRIVREIGRGGMGIVYEAIQLSLGRRVAVKVLPFVASLDPTRLQRFKNEAQAAAQLHHTNIVPVYAVGSQRGVHFYAMQLIEGHSLAALIAELRQAKGKTGGQDASDNADIFGREVNFDPASQQVAVAQRLDEQQRHDGQVRPPNGVERRSAKLAEPAELDAMPAASAAAQVETGSPTTTVLTADHPNPTSYFRTVAALIAQAAAALEHAHKFGIVHRDIKPANLLLDQHGNLWVTDFGLAQFHCDVQLTRTGDTLGTLRYMSPEQAAGGRAVIDHRTDVYSLGITLYELLTLEPGFPLSDGHALLRQIVEDEPALPRSLDKNIPVELETIVLKATAKAPGERYATARYMADDLERWLEDKPILARRPTVLERAARWRRRHRSLVVSAVLFLFLATLGLLATTVVVMREHNKTLRAYDRETKQRAAAEESFHQARAAVDTFSQLAEEELANRPMMYQLRRRFLQTALEYYQTFLAQRGNDPSVQRELAATSDRVARIVDELSALEDFLPMLLLSGRRVQQELALAPAQREKIDDVLGQFWTARNQARESEQQLALESRQQQLVGILRNYKERIAAVLSQKQVQRLEQISRRQQLPFAFKSPDVVAALNLTPDQRKHINQIIEVTDPHHQHPRPGDFFPPGEEFPERRPRNFVDANAVAGHGGPSGKGGDPQHAPEQAGADWRDHHRRQFEHGPGEHGRGEFGSMPDAINHTVSKILEVLTPYQRTKWEELIGDPFTNDLHYGPDEWMPSLDPIGTH